MQVVKQKIFLASLVWASIFVTSGCSGQSAVAHAALNDSSPQGTHALLASATMVRSVNSSKVIDIYDGINSDGARIQQYDAWNGPMQQWVLDTQADGNVAIRNPLTDKVLDVTAMSTQNGAIVQLYTFWNGPNQLWTPQSQGAGVYTFINVNSGKCLDLLGLRMDDGAPVGQWDCNGKPNQQWQLSAAAAPPTPGPALAQTFRLLSIWDDLTSSTLDEGTIQGQMTKMQQQVGQNRNYFKVGFAHVYGGHDTLVRNTRLSQTNNLSLGVIVPLQTHDVDGSVTNLASQDFRNYQWRLDGATWAGEVVQSNGSQEFPTRDWKVVTPSRYAKDLHALYVSEAATTAADINAVMQQYPDTITAVNAVIEEELATGGGDSDAYLADYSPFAIAEFRDWLRHTGIYDDADGANAGQGAREATVGFVTIGGVERSQFYDDPSPSDNGGSGQSFNSYFGVNFSSWSLAYWDLDEFPNAITDTNFNPTPQSGNGATAGGFDAPRHRDATNNFWNAWSYDVADHAGAEPAGNPSAPAFGFRQFLIKHFVGDILAAIAAQGIPKQLLYAHQIPGEQINAPRALSGADPLWTALWDDSGTLGSTRFGGYDSSAADSYSLNWGIFEWHPAPNLDPDDPALYQATTAALDDFYSHHGYTFFPGWWSNGAPAPIFPLNDSQMAQAMHDWLNSHADVAR